MAEDTIHLAILDDYANIAPQHFQHIPNLVITSIPSTVSSYPTPAALEAQAARLHPFSMISTMRERTPFPYELLVRLSNLKLILTTSARNASIDLRVCSEREIVVTGTQGSVPTTAAQRKKLPDLPSPPGHSTVVQHAWALLLALCSRLPRDDAALRTPPGTAWQSGLMVPLAGKTLGIVGLGKLGVGMAKVGTMAFGMNVLAWSESLTQAKADQAAELAGLPAGSWLVAMSKERLFRDADVVSLHYVLSERSRGIVGARELGWMKKTAVLVNTSRGALINEQALIMCLTEGGIGGVALDVFWEEPLPPESHWRRAAEWSRSEVVLSPHMGYVSMGTMHRWYQEQAEEVVRWTKMKKLVNRMN